MSIDVQMVINSDVRYISYLRDNSYWYKYLNRSDEALKGFMDEVKDKYEMKTSDKINRLVDNINMFGAFLEALK